MDDLNSALLLASINGNDNDEEDTIDYFVVDNDFRSISIPQSKKILGVESDDDVNVLYFKVPRMYGPIDLGDFSYRINYMNANQDLDMYLVTDKEVFDDYITFSWTVGRNACRYYGNVSFIVCARISDGGGTVTKEFNTAVHTLSVLRGLEVDTEAMYEEYQDIIEQLLINVQSALQPSDIDDELDVNSTNPVQNKVVTAEISNRANKKAPSIHDTASGIVSNFPDGADTMPLKSLIVNIEPVQAGSGDPSPENVRPISGWTGCEVTRAEKNFCPMLIAETKNGQTLVQNADGTVTLNGTFNRTTNNTIGTTAFTLPAGTYILTGNISGGNDYALALTINGVDRYDYGSGNIFTLTETKQVTIKIYIKYSASLPPAENLVFKPMIRFASDTDATFAPYSGTTFPISWQTEAGTVYYGTIDIISGVLYALAAIFDMGDLTYTETTGGIRFDIIGGVGAGSQGAPAAFAMCSAYKLYVDTIQNISQITLPNNCFVQTTASGARARYYIRDDRYTTAATMKAGLSGVQFLCELREPIVYQLTPTEVTTLLGQNNIWANCGPVTAEYPADTKLFIQKINTPNIEDIADLTDLTNRKAGMLVDTASGSIASFVPDSTIDNLLGLTVDIEPVQSGSGDPSPTNIRPISGWTGCTVLKFSESVVSPDQVLEGRLQASGEFNSSTTTRCATQDFIPAEPGTTYTVAVNAGVQCIAAHYYAAADEGSWLYRDALVGQVSTFTTPENCACIRLMYAKNNTNETISPAEITATVVAVAPALVELSFPTEAGTIYGGTLDVTAGVLTVTYGYVDMGILAWATQDVEHVFRCNLSGRRYGANSAGIYGICDSYSFYGNASLSVLKSTIQNGQFGFQSTTNGVFVRNNSCTTVGQIKSALTGAYLVYPLDTPITYQLTPTEVTTLLGQNNIFADAGDVSVEFAADLKHYIDSKIAAAVAVLS